MAGKEKVAAPLPEKSVRTGKNLAGMSACLREEVPAKFMA
jgi:hypothetical protein